MRRIVHVIGRIMYRIGDRLLAWSSPPATKEFLAEVQRLRESGRKSL